MQTIFSSNNWNSVERRNLGLVFSSIILIILESWSIGPGRAHAATIIGGDSVSDLSLSSIDENTLVGTYKISPKPCTVPAPADSTGSNEDSTNRSNTNQELRGTCMFVWECLKTEGKHLGMCVDGFMFGSCCAHSQSTNDVFSNSANINKTLTTQLPFVTNNSNNSTWTTSSASTSTTHRPVTKSTTERPTTTTTQKIPTVTTTDKYADILSWPSSPFLWDLTTTTTERSTTTSAPSTITTTTTTSTSTTTSRPQPTTTPRPSTHYVNLLTSSTPTAEPEVVLEGDVPCGQAPLYPQMRIVGGKEASFGLFPWIASVRRTSFFGFSSTHRCGGALLNQNWIATAGHCVDDLLTSQIRVRLGEWDFSSSTNPSNSGNSEKYTHVERTIVKKVVHPSYNFFTYENDLALLQLETPIKFSPHISPICLPGNNDLLIGENATVAGWGRLSENGQLPSRLQHVVVPIMSNAKCRELFLKSNRVEHIPDIFLCAGYEKGGQDSCQGDSGGPLQVRGRDGKYFLGGIISWGIGCAEPNMPGVCTRVSKFIEWILAHVT